MKFLSTFLLAVILFVSSWNISIAQWQKMDGPYFFSVQDLVLHNGKLYMAAETSSNIPLHVSTDQGKTWSDVPIPGYSPYLRNLSVNSGALVVATGDRLHISDDEGATWVTRELPGLSPRSFYSYNNVLLSSDNKATYVSVDLGESWHRSPDNTLPRVFYQTAVEGDVLYIPAANRILAVSMYQGFTIGEIRMDGYALHGIHTDDNTIYCGTDKGIIVSYDNGASWESYVSVVDGIRGVYSDDTYIYGLAAFVNRIYRVNKHTSALDSLSIPFTERPEDRKFKYGIIRLDRGTVIDNNFYLYVSAKGLAMSSDHGETWHKRNGHVAATTIYKFTSMGNHLFGSALYAGLFESSTGGRSWVEIDYNGHYYDCMNISNNATTLFTTSFVGDILASTDHGDTWDIIAMPQAPYNDMSFRGPYAFVATDGALFQSLKSLRVSSDMGGTWQETAEQGRYLKRHGNSVYLVIENGVAWTEDDGKTWKESIVGFCANDPRYRIEDFAVTDDAIMVVVDSFLFVNEGNGQAWQSVPTPTNLSGTVRLFSAGGGFILTDYSAAKVFFTRSNGVVWKEIGQGLPGVPIAYYEHNGYLYASMDGVWRRPMEQLLPAGKPAPPAAFALSQNYPNPVSGRTTIRYELPRPQHVALTVTNALGREVTRLADGRMDAGPHSVQFSTGGLVPGVYFYTLRSGNATLTKSMLVTR